MNYGVRWQKDVVPISLAAELDAIDCGGLRAEFVGSSCPTQLAMASNPDLRHGGSMHRSHWFVTATLLATVTSNVATTPATAADAAAEFYAGKTITLLIGFGPGGGYDTYARALARHLEKHMPGHPNVVPQNMPGAGGLAAANYLYNLAPPDGLTIATFGPFNALEPLFDNPAARFDPTKLTWIGKMDTDAGACGAWKSAGIERFSDVQKKEVVFGSSGRASTTTQQVLVLKHLLGAKVRIVQGYRGSADIILAMRRGEVGAMCGIATSNVVMQLKNDVDNGNIKMFIQFGRKNESEFGNAENIYDLLLAPEDKQVAEIIFLPNELGKPIAAPPGVPADRTKALRDAFKQTIGDPAFLDEMRKLNLPISIATGEEIGKIFTTLYAMPKSLIERAQTYMTGE
jgi:tripartite-type tricarboxylate transporter receptor subunit TctC